MGIFSNIFNKETKGSTLILDLNGSHSIGGKADPLLKIPELETSPVVYFGNIRKNDPALSLVDFNFNLICPIFLNLYNPVFFDYTDPMSPRLIRENVETDFSQYFQDIPGSAYIEYQELKFNFDQSKDPNLIYPKAFGTTGKPNWIQNDDWPTCPTTGNKMKFLMQLGDIDDCKTFLGQEILDKEYIDPYLHFGHGDLYIFFEPESRIVAYINQVT